MAVTEKLGLDGDLDLGAFTGAYTNVEKIASADDDSTVSSCPKVDSPTTRKSSLQSTTITTVLQAKIRARLKYETGQTATVTAVAKTAGGATIVSTGAITVTDVWTTFEEVATGSWSQATINAAEFWLEFTTGSGMGVDTLKFTAGELEVSDTIGDGPPDPILLEGISNGVSSTAGAMVVDYALVGASAAVSTAAGDLTGDFHFAGVAAGVSTVAGSLAMSLTLAGTTGGVSTAAGTLSVVRNLAGTSAGQSSASGDLTRTDFLGPDTLRFYLTGAASDGGDQDVPADSLGGYRSSTEADRVGKLIVNLPTEIDLLQASRINGVGGSGSIMVVDRNTLRYAAPGGSAGPPMAILDGETRILVDGTDPSKFVRVARSGTDGIYGNGVIELLDQRNNVFAMSDAADAEHSSGSAKYRAVMLRAGRAITNVKAWIMPLGPSAVCSGGVLGGSGSGTITSNTANAFVAWPWKGWAWISNAGTLREIVYYSARTATTLTVPSLGRARLGTSAAAGDLADVVWPVPPYRIAWELASPAVDGPVQVIANENASPTGVSWSTAITLATGIAIGSLAEDEQGALWLHRELPAGVSGSPIHDCRLGVSFDASGETYAETLAGLFRIAQASLAGYELRIGTDAPPAMSAAPVVTSATLPITYSPLAPDHEYHLALDLRNQWDVLAQSIQSTVVRVTDDGDVRPAPAAPYLITWSAGAGGVFSLEAFYSRYSDQIYDAAATPPRWVDNADSWLIYTTFNGTDPDPDVDTPTVVAMVLVDNIERITWTSAVKTAGTVGKVIVRTRRSASVSGEDDDVDSANVDVHSATAATAGPSGNRLRGFQRRSAEIL